MSVLPSIWIYPHLPRYAGELGIVQFRMNLEARMRGEPIWDRSWRTNFFRAKEGDAVIFSFRENEQWFVVGDAVVFKIEELEEAKPKKLDGDLLLNTNAFAFTLETFPIKSYLGIW